MQRNIDFFLGTYPANTGEGGTHTSMSGRPAPGKFSIPEVFLTEFVDSVYDAIWNENRELHLTESHPKNGCRLVVDVDLRFNTKDLDMNSIGIVYTSQDLIQIVRKYQDFIHELYPEASLDKLTCWVFQRKTGGYLHTKNHQIWKDGFHLLFPDVVLAYPVLNWIRSRIVKWVGEMKAEGGFLEGATNSPDEMIDATVVEKGRWLMYGTNKPGLAAYNWTCIVPFKDNGEIQPIDDDKNTTFVTRDIYRKTSLMLSGEYWTTDHLSKEVKDYGKRIGIIEKVNAILEGENQQNPMGQAGGDLEGIPGTYAETLALMRSGQLQTSGAPNTEDCLLAPVDTKIMVRRANQAITSPPHANKNFVEDLLGVLKPARCETYQDWFLVGAALHHENSGTEWFEMWREWSSSASNYDLVSCETKWFREYGRYNGENPVTLATIRKMAREDNAKGYLEVVDKYKERDEFFALVRDACMSMTEQDFARILHFMCESEFAFSEGDWYQYLGHRWAMFPKKRGGQIDTTILRKKIAEDLLSFYYAYQYFLAGKSLMAQTSHNDGIRDSFDELSKLVTRVTMKLKTTTMKRHIIEEAEILFLKSSFVDKLDMNPYLLGFDNGVMDLKTGAFRRGHHSDMVSMTVGYDFNAEVNPVVREEIMKLLVSIQPDKEIRDFMLTYFASTLIGTNKNEVFVNLEGTGGNGKGVWTTLHDTALGEYSGTLNNNYLVNVSSSPESHNTMLAANYKKRYLQVNEPPNTHGKRLNTNFIKELTGGDKIQLRMAHSADTKTVEPMFKLCMLFNEFPTLENPNDGGFMRRFVGINFPNKFIDGEPKRPNEYKSDPALKEKIKSHLEWKQQYMLILLDYLKLYRENGEILNIPKTVRARTKELLTEQDPVDEFLRAEIAVTCEKEDIMSRKDLYAGFQEYVKANFMGQKISMKVSQFQDRVMSLLPAEVEFKSRYTVQDTGMKKTHTNTFLGMKWANESVIITGQIEEE